MATIIARRRRDGAMRYTVQIRIKRSGKTIYQESRTFSRRGLAREWAKRRELELQSPGGMDRAKAGSVRIGDLIERYIEEMEGIRPLGVSKKAQLGYISRMPIADCDALAISIVDLMAHIQERRSRGTGPTTTLNDMIFLRGVFGTARSMWGIPIDMQVLEDAVRQARSLHLIRKSQRRDRRPTPEELQRLRDYFSERDARSDIPMRDIVDFAIASSWRQGEITEIRWDDLRKDNRTALIRDSKHPRYRSGHDKWRKLTKEAWAIIERQPETDIRVFPYNPRSIGAAWQRACKRLGIKDLRFHDTRAEGISRLFERGYQIHEVMMFSGHESWATLQIYARLKPGDVVERG